MAARLLGLWCAVFVAVLIGSAKGKRGLRKLGDDAFQQRGQQVYVVINSMIRSFSLFFVNGVCTCESICLIHGWMHTDAPYLIYWQHGDSISWSRQEALKQIRLAHSTAPVYPWEKIVSTPGEP